MGLPLLTFLGLGALLTLGTVYSVLYSTYLDTSDPLLSYLPHPLADTHYFASKKSLLNTVFIKNAWGWTSGAFFLLFFLASKLPSDPLPPPAPNEEVEDKPNGRFVYAPASTGSNADGKRKPLRWEDHPTPSQRLSATIRPVLRWVVLTAAWALFTAWFFGPALLTRVTLATGGECVLVMPPQPPTLAALPPDTDLKTHVSRQARVFPVPAHLCHSNAPISADTHPAVFAALFSDPSTDSSSTVGGLTALAFDELTKKGYKARPRIRRGHDVSGHVFLITLAALFLAELIQSSLAQLRALEARVPRVVNGRSVGVMKDSLLVRAAEAERKTGNVKSSKVGRRVTAFKVGVALNGALLGVWVLAMYTTGIYFHTPFEKITGFVLGAGTYALSLYLMPNRAVTRSTATKQPSPPPSADKQKQKKAK